MNLIIDIGNTRAKLLAMEEGKTFDEATSDSETLAGLPAFANSHQYSKGIVSSVARMGEKTKKALAQLPCPLLWLNHSTPLPVHTTFPPTTGSDRVAAVVGAMIKFPDTPLLIVDAGTCITFEFVDNEGRYLGGNIAPGLRMRLQAMHEHTALLPQVETNGEAEEIGHDTTSAMLAGATMGLKHEVEGYIRQYKQKFPNLQVVITGGDTPQLSDEWQDIVHTDPYLVPRGLDSILTHNL